MFHIYAPPGAKEYVMSQSQVWMATVREGGKLYPINVSDEKSDVVMDAMLNSRIAVQRAQSPITELYWSKEYQEALPRTRTLFGLTSGLPQELLRPDSEVIGYLVELKTKSVFFSIEESDVQMESRVFGTYDEAYDAASKYSSRHNGTMSAVS